MSPYFMVGDLGYKICKMKVGDDIYYRPSHNGSFITPPLQDLDEAKAACDRYAEEVKE